ncbi:MAG: hypothetical protein H6813_05285 [Phycisphaeraceae bacterium]|nr:hypothetical protein [Phycisphaeraceae bacterium]
MNRNTINNRTGIGALTALAAITAVAIVSPAQARTDRERAEAALVPTANGSFNASGFVEVERRSNRIEFKVEIEDIAVGAYDLYVNDTHRGVLNAVAVPGGVEAEIEFRDPPQPGKIPLDFDPLGASVEIRQDGIAILSGVSPNLGGANSDDNSNSNPGSPGSGDLNKQKSSAFLFATDEFPPARGDMKLNVSKKKGKLIIKTLMLPAGDYDVLCDGIAVGSITSKGRKGKGKASFSTKPGNNDQAMSFDPVGALVQIVQDNLIFLEGTIDGQPVGGGIPPAGIAEAVFSPTAIAPGASGDVRYRLRADSVDFNVEIEDVPLGTYTLLIDGVEVAMFDVVNTATGPQGEVEFRDPVEPGKLLLDFNPLGAVIQIINDEGDVVLGAELPSQTAGS